ncbi:MAG TPA: sugar ABC transporter ATP-binding protein, partial [Sphaerochaeta sp.]|nr:sugar ABC transporter ATP-binding protein [Sphaerochaeta sp.]
MQKALLEVHNLTKIFPGIRALDDVHLSIRSGEVHALIGENGAG